MNQLIINRGQGGLGRQPVGSDYISGFISWLSSGNLTSLGWTSGTVKSFSGISTNYGGITGAHIGETKSIAVITMAETAAAGELLNIYVQEPLQNVLIASYVTVTGDMSSANNYATNVTAAINATTNTNGGYTATASTDTVLITARPGLGVFLNSGTPLSATGVAGLADVTITEQFGTGSSGATAGIASPVDNLFYHINRFFTQCPNGTLYVGLWTTPNSWSAYTFPEIAALQVGATGSARQIGVFIPTTFALAQIPAIQAQVATLIANFTPASVIIGADITTTWVNVSALTSLLGENSEHVSVSVGQDGAAQGAFLFKAYGKSITQVGDILGMCATSQVSDSIAWFGGGYNLAIDGVENAVPAFATGEFLNALTTGTINQVDSYGYIFGKNFANNNPAGTVVNNPYCATASTSDYFFIFNNRTFDKAARQLYAAYIQQLAAPLTVQKDGTLTAASVAYFEGLGTQALQNMLANNPNTGRPELSGANVTINPAQNVLSTSTLIIAVALQPIGVANTIIINLSFSVTT